MKLLIISSDYPEIFGGVSDYTYNLSKALVNEDIDVYVLTTNNPEVKIEGKPKVLPLIKNWNLFSLPQIIAVVKDVKPDFISLQYVPYTYNYYGIPLWLSVFVVWLRLNDYKLITTFHEIAMKFNFFKPKYWVVAILQQFIKYVIAIASFKIVVTIDYWKKILWFFRDKTVRIPVGSNIIPYLVPENETIDLKQKIAPNGEIIISTFGSFAPYRRWDLVLEAIKKIKDRESSILIKVLFIGSSDTNFREGLEEKIAQLNLNSNVVFTGSLKPQDVYKHLVISDIFVALSVHPYGGIGMKSGSVAAAYAAGLPIIGTEGLVTDDFFRDGENVLFAKSLEVEDISAAILRLIKDKNLSNKLKFYSLDSYNKSLNWTIIGRKYVELMRYS